MDWKAEVPALIAEMRAKLAIRTQDNAPIIDRDILTMSDTLALLTRESSLPFPELEGIRL